VYPHFSYNKFLLSFYINFLQLPLKNHKINAQCIKYSLTKSELSSNKKSLVVFVVIASEMNVVKENEYKQNR
jgi:hypothetical protein